LFEKLIKKVYSNNMNSKIKNTTPDPRSFTGFLLWQTSNNWDKFINNKLKDFGLNQTEMLHLISIYWILEQYKEVNQTVLANFTGFTTMGVSKLLSKLEKLGLISRHTGVDSRSKLVNITPKGKELLFSTAYLLVEAHHEFFSIAENKKLIKSLAKLG
jgi:DNA-binding MarR family transcriptional regulator